MNTISRVQELADERGLTLCQLSKICDLSEATIRTAKKRGNQLSVDTIERICEAYWIPSRYPVFFECVKSSMTNTFASTTSSHGTSSSYGR